ncbi:glutathione S-transferase U17-like [Senna tora]|uniref:Glutathione S-transferase U17-like n=1 Tax=Senna tora TaxID=362788 RepID=A0A834ST48_9FABA|nr:glutathione S-transferase U17-like [Senna tora]
MEDVMEKCSKGKAFFGGDHIGLVNITFGSFLRWLSVIESMNGRKVLVGAKTPALVKWAEKFASDPNVKVLLSETEKLMEFAMVLQVKWKAAAAAPSDGIHFQSSKFMVSAYTDEFQMVYTVVVFVLEKHYA